MNEATLTKVVAELKTDIVGRKLGKFFVLGDSAFAVDLRPHDGRYLYVSALPSEPRMFLFRRTLKQLNKSRAGITNFTDFLRKRLAGSEIGAIEKVENDRIVSVSATSQDEFGKMVTYFLIIQLTGSSSNVFLTDAQKVIIAALRRPHGQGQRPGEHYLQPEKSGGRKVGLSNGLIADPIDGSISEGLDQFYEAKRTNLDIAAASANARSSINSKLKKSKRLLRKLNQDLEKHGDPEKWKRLGDLIKANLGTAVRKGDQTVLIDYFDESLPEVILEIEETKSLNTEAERYFKKYSKSVSAQKEISVRIEETRIEIERLSEEREVLEQAIKKGDTSLLDKFRKRKKRQSEGNKKSAPERKLAHEYISSDGLSILVGKRSKDNDRLTFKVAKSLDLWLHAADYPGSHVVVRKNKRGDVPEKTLLEAAQLAAFYSKARNESKAAVNYTERKHVNKQKGAAPGLVSLSSFKTIVVQPKVPLEKVDNKNAGT